MIAAMGLERGEVYIGNIMNWRPELPRGADGAQWATGRPPRPRWRTACRT